MKESRREASERQIRSTRRWNQLSGGDVLRRFQKNVRPCAHGAAAFPRLHTSPTPELLEIARGPAPCAVVLPMLAAQVNDYWAAGLWTACFIIASKRLSTLVPAGERLSTSLSRPSSTSMVKPCTSDQARAIAAAWSSVSASSEICSCRLAPMALASPANDASAASCSEAWNNPAARCGTSARTCRDGPWHSRHRRAPVPAPLPDTAHRGSRLPPSRR